METKVELEVPHTGSLDSSTDNIIDDDSIVNEDESINDLDNCDKIHRLLQNMSNFRIERILKNDLTQKLMAIEGKFKGCKKAALIILEKKVFPDEEILLNQGIFNSITCTKKKNVNDIYRVYDFFPNSEFNVLSGTVIYPATPKHIEKFTPAEYFLIEETPEMYQKITLPHLLSDKQFSIQWVDNILDGTAEADRVLFNDKDEEVGFVLVKDFKWKNDNIPSLYLIAIARKKLGSLRDLSKEHLPLLRNIQTESLNVIKETYGLDGNKIRVFLHYQPSYYQLHVHFTTLTVENAGITTERAHLLTTVINNIEMCSDYYQKATLTFKVCKYKIYEPYEKYLKGLKRISNDGDDEAVSKPKKQRTE